MNKKQLIEEVKEVFQSAMDSESTSPDAFEESNSANRLTKAQYRVCLTVADYLHRRMYAPDHSIGYSGTLGKVMRGLRAALGHFDFIQEASIQIVEHTSHMTVYHSHKDIMSSGFKLRLLK